VLRKSNGVEGYMAWAYSLVYRGSRWRPYIV
jgi:hypothetical protein